MFCAPNHLSSSYAVDRAISDEGDRLVVILFGAEQSEPVGLVSSTMCRLARMAIMYTVNLEDVPDFVRLYGLTEPFAFMLFYRGARLQGDYGAGLMYKLTMVPDDEEFIAVIEAAYVAAHRGKMMFRSPLRLMEG
ncbi:Mitosis protein DIM1 [Giardia muris]|uniref:Mitosis protein DIM1 n=1 Tax=Giardia muris TaxID=5742 RepID=A0A4Z1TBE0_GIAMU|nr:Mitosis protein DIM1 [Giardia muris]|eukprot:TNJ29839.1 Mitosis protein DIM1 [Giardia muris]